MTFRDQFAERLRKEHDREVDTVLVIDDLHAAARAIVPGLPASTRVKEVLWQEPHSLDDHEPEAEANELYEHWRRARAEFPE